MISCVDIGYHRVPDEAAQAPWQALPAKAAESEAPLAGGCWLGAGRSRWAVELPRRAEIPVPGRLQLSASDSWLLVHYSCTWYLAAALCYAKSHFNWMSRLLAEMKRINLKKIKISPEPVTAMAARGPDSEACVWGAIYVRPLSVDWQVCGTTAKRLSAFIPFQKIWIIAQRLSNVSREQFWTAKLAPAQLAPAQHSLLHSTLGGFNTFPMMNIGPAPIKSIIGKIRNNQRND